MFETPLSSSMSSSNTSSARSSSSSSKRNTHFTPKNTPVPRTHKHGHSHGHNHNHNLNHSHSHNLSHVDSPFSAPALDGGSARNTPAFSHSGSVQNRVSVSTFSAERKRLGAQSFRHRIRMNRRHRHSSGRGIYTTATDKAGTPSIVSHPHTFTDKQTKSAVYSVPSSTDASSRFTNDATLREIRDWNLDAPLPTSSSTSSSSSTLAPFASAQATSSSSSSVFKKPASPSVASPSYSFSASHVSFPQSLSSASPSSSQSPSQSLSSSPTLSPSSVARELSPSTLTRRLQAQSAQSAPHLQVTQCHQPQFKVPITIPAYSDLRFHSHDDEDNEEEDNESSRLSPSSMALTTTSVSPSASLPPASAAYPGSSSSPSLTRSFSFAADSPVSHFSNVHLSHLSDVHRGVRELTQQRVGAALEQHDSSTGVVSSLEQDILLQMQSLNLHKSAREERERSMEEEIQLRILKKKIAKTMGPELLEELLEAVIWDEIGAVKKTFPLSQEEEEESEDLLYEEDNYVLIDLFNQEITTELLSCLQIGTWLNDEVMNFYMALLIQRNKRTLANQQAPAHAKLKCHFFNSFFYTKLYCKGQYKYKNVRKWSKKAKVDILQLDKVFAPIHVGNNHWCCGVINVRDKRFEYYDSLGGRNPACLKSLRKYVVDEAKQYHDLDLDVSDWQDYSPSSIPRQRNGCDCGVFTCKFIDYLSEDRPLTFRQKQMPYFRYRMALEIKLATVL